MLIILTLITVAIAIWTIIASRREFLNINNNCMSQEETNVLSQEEELKEKMDAKMDNFRAELKAFAGNLLAVKKDFIKSPTNEGKLINDSEVIANLTIAYRAIEDASMRLGKVKQALNEGVSVYDENVVGSPEAKADPRETFEGDCRGPFYT